MGASIDNPNQNIQRVMKAWDQFYDYYDHYSKLLGKLIEDGFIDENFEEQYREFQLKADIDYKFTEVNRIDKLQWKENEAFYQISPQDKKHYIRYAVIGPDKENVVGSISWSEFYDLERKLNPMDSTNALFTEYDPKNPRISAIRSTDVPQNIENLTGDARVKAFEKLANPVRAKSTEFRTMWENSHYDPRKDFRPEHLLRITSQRGHTPTRLEDTPYFPELNKKMKELDSSCLPAIEQVVNNLKKVKQLAEEKQSSYDDAMNFQIAFGILGGITWITAAITYFIHRSECADLKQQIEDLESKQSKLETEYRQNKKLLASGESAKHPFKQEVHYHHQAVNTLFKAFKERYEYNNESDSEESSRRNRSYSSSQHESSNDETSNESTSSRSVSPSKNNDK